jgi:uncharacterized protein (TIGR00725 family)
MEPLSTGIFLMKNDLIFIGVIGGSEVPPAVAAIAEEVGKEIAIRKAVLICGGMGGVMEAACKGAASEGGLTIGILPGDSREQANEYVRVPIVTGIGYARNVAVVKSSQAVIAIDGSYGTLTEISYALQAGIPVIGLGTWTFSSKNQPECEIIPAENPKEAVELAIKLIKSK